MGLKTLSQTFEVNYVLYGDDDEFVRLIDALVSDSMDGGQYMLLQEAYAEGNQGCDAHCADVQPVIPADGLRSPLNSGIGSPRNPDTIIEKAHGC